MSALTKALQKKNWHFRSKDETIKDFKLKIFFLKKNIHSSSNIESLYTKHVISSPFL